MDWSDWQPLSEESNRDGAAVYEVRMVRTVRGRDHPVAIPLSRFLASDPGGLLVIGETSRMQGRRRDFIRGMDTGQGHSEGNLLYLLIKHSLLKRRH